MASAFPIVDLFAGPGGLGEGFSAFRDSRGRHPFRIVLSVEKEASAFETLRLRSFLRQFDSRFPKEYYASINEGAAEPDWEQLYPNEWRAACNEVQRLELGTSRAKSELRPRLKAIRTKASGDAILIGGPPCQAYSLVGRVRNRGIKGYKARDDQRHFLYREYIEVIRELQPAVFVMENVKGMISSSVDGKRIFELVLDDLRWAGGKRDSYRLFALAPGARGRMEAVSPADQRSFVLCTEDFGIPQARHRVILLGVRSDIARRRATGKTHQSSRRTAQQESARSVLEGLPKLRSGLSRHDSHRAWSEAVTKGLAGITGLARSSSQYADISRQATKLRKAFPKKASTLRRSARRRPRMGAGASTRLRKWILDPRLRVAPNNLTRTHMSSDLARYLFASIFGQVRRRSPRSHDFPRRLFPAHRSWNAGIFNDRFRVQLYDQPSTTITSHISKDGHYFIHPDPLQCRSLTVREAARLQTFPDNYLFKGTRTEQYVQVGNAVPPYLALQIAAVVSEILENRS